MARKSRGRIAGQALAEMALALPIGILAVVVAINALILVHVWSIVQDSARTGLVISMDSRMASATCPAPCATAAVRQQIRRVGSQIGLSDSDIRLGDVACGDGGLIAWSDLLTAWQPGQQYTICVSHDWRAFGPFIPDQTFTLHSELTGKRL